MYGYRECMLELALQICFLHVRNYKVITMIPDYDYTRFKYLAIWVLGFKVLTLQFSCKKQLKNSTARKILSH